LDRICGCFEGRCSIQLSYGRTTNYCDPIIDLTALWSDLLELRFPRCAQFCAHLTAARLQTWHCRTDEHSETKFQSGYDRRCSPASRHRSRIHPNESRTCGVRNRAQRGAQAWNCFFCGLFRDHCECLYVMFSGARYLDMAAACLSGPDPALEGFPGPFPTAFQDRSDSWRHGQNAPQQSAHLTRNADAHIWDLKLRPVDSGQVLHRPIETARTSGELAIGVASESLAFR
jgi:hypothetical protein